MSAAGPTKVSTAPTSSVPLACVLCRERHVKCNGGQPACSRCVFNSQRCIYVQSRRGQRPFRKMHTTPTPTDPVVPHVSCAVGLSDELQYAANLQSLSVARSAAYFPSAAGSNDISHRPQSQDGLLTRQQMPGTMDNPDMRLQELYYLHFHDSHPFIVPQQFYQQAFADTGPSVLAAAIECIGSRYSTLFDESSYLRKLEVSVFAADTPQDGYLVQALLLLTLLYHSLDWESQMRDTLEAATHLALKLDMNQTPSRIESEGSPILQESWRRTWWELYCTNISIAVICRDVTFRLQTTELNIKLPWEEAEYRKCTPGISRSIKDMDEDAFFGEDTPYSSFAYKITATRELSKMLRLNQPFCPNSTEIVTSADAALNTWLLHLPEHKKTPIGAENRVDEMMFQAHMIVNAALISLHRPRSDLMFTQVSGISDCRASRHRIEMPTTKFAVHTAKAVQAADRLSGLLTLPGQMSKHTVFLICAIAMSTLVHLSAYVLSKDGTQRAAFRESIGLSVSALKSVKQLWPLADSILQKIKVTARETIAFGKQVPSPVQDLGEATGTVEDGMLLSRPRSDQWLERLPDTLFTEVLDLDPGDHLSGF